jgi:hypothetical protein
MLAMFLYTGYGRSEEPGHTMMKGWLRTRRLSSNPICPAVLWAMVDLRKTVSSKGCSMKVFQSRSSVQDAPAFRDPRRCSYSRESPLRWTNRIRA